MRTPLLPWWAARPWGAVRIVALIVLVLGLTVVPALGSIDLDDGPSLLLWVPTLGVALAGAVSSSRAGAVPLDLDTGGDWRVRGRVRRALWGDAGWSAVLVAVALAVRELVRQGDGMPATDLRQLGGVLALWVAAYLVGAVTGLVVGLAIAFVVRLLPGRD